MTSRRFYCEWMEELQTRTDTVMLLVNNWLRENHLELAEEKTEFLVITLKSCICNANQSKYTRKRDSRVKGRGLERSKLTFFSYIRNTMVKAGKASILSTAAKIKRNIKIIEPIAHLTVFTEALREIAELIPIGMLV